MKSRSLHNSHKS